MRAIAVMLLVACGAPPCPPEHAQREEWWPLPGTVHLEGDTLDRPSRDYLEEVVHIVQNRSDVRALRVEGRTEADARAVADILVGMGIARDMIEIAFNRSDPSARLELSLLLAREG